MNISMVISSFEYVTCNFHLLSSLSKWIYLELSSIKYVPSILIQSFKIKDIDVAESIIHLNNVDKVIDTLLIKTINNKNIYDGRFIKILLQEGAEMDDLMLIKAVAYNRPDIVKLLLSFDADVHISDDKPIRDATVFNFSEIVKILLEYDADPCVYDNYCLKYASSNKSNYDSIIRSLLEHGADVHVDNDAPLRNACCKEQCLETIRILINFGANVYDNKNIMLHAIKINNIELVKLLIQSGADIHFENNQALIDACHYSRAHIAKLLLTDVDIDCLNKALITIACTQKDNRDAIHFIRLLLDRGVDINIKNGAPLKNACKHNNINIVSYLLEKGAIVTSKALKESVIQDNNLLYSLLINSRNIDVDVIN